MSTSLLLTSLTTIQGMLRALSHETAPPSAVVVESTASHERLANGRIFPRHQDGFQGRLLRPFMGATLCPPTVRLTKGGERCYSPGWAIRAQVCGDVTVPAHDKALALMSQAGRVLDPLPDYFRFYMWPEINAIGNSELRWLAVLASLNGLGVSRRPRRSGLRARSFWVIEDIVRASISAIDRIRVIQRFN